MTRITELKPNEITGVLLFSPTPPADRLPKKTVKVLFDREDNEPVGVCGGDIDLREAVTRHIKATGWWDSDYSYAEDEVRRTGQQYVEAGLYSEDFKIIAVPEL